MQKYKHVHVMMNITHLSYNSKKIKPSWEDVKYEVDKFEFCLRGNKDTVESACITCSKLTQISIVKKYRLVGIMA